MSLLIWTIASVLAASAVAASEEEKRRELVNKAWEHYLLRQSSWEVLPADREAYLVYLDRLQEAGELPPGWQWWKVLEGWIPLPRGWIGYVDSVYQLGRTHSRRKHPRKRHDPSRDKWVHTTKTLKLLDPVVHIESRERAMSRILGLYQGRSLSVYDTDIEREPYAQGKIVVLQDQAPDGEIDTRSFGELLEEFGPAWRNDLLQRTGSNVDPDAHIPLWMITYDNEEKDSDIFDNLERLGVYLAKIDGQPAYLDVDTELFEEIDIETAVIGAIRVGFRVAWIPTSLRRYEGGEWYILHPLPETFPEWTGWDRLFDREGRAERDALAREATRRWAPSTGDLP